MIIYISTDIGHSKWVSIASYSRHYSIMNPFCFVSFYFAKPERVRACNYFCPHAHYVSYISTHSCCSTFVWHNLRRVIMRLMTHYNAPTFSAVILGYCNNSSIFFGSQNHIRSFCRKLF